MKWREEMDGGEMQSNGAISSSNRSLWEGKVEKHDHLTGKEQRQRNNNLEFMFH